METSDSNFRWQRRKTGLLFLLISSFLCKSSSTWDVTAVGPKSRWHRTVANDTADLTMTSVVYPRIVVLTLATNTTVNNWNTYLYIYEVLQVLKVTTKIFFTFTLLLKEMSCKYIFQMFLVWKMKSVSAFSFFFFFCNQK